MSSHACFDVEQQLWRYIDRELTASEISSISSHLKRCESCQQLYHDGARETNGYRTAFVNAPFGEPFVTRFRKRMAAEALVESGGLGVGGRPGGTARRSSSDRVRRLRRLVAVLAMVGLIPLVLTLGFFYGRPSLGQFFTEGGGIRLVRGGETKSRELKRGEILGGDRFSVSLDVVANLAVPTTTHAGISQLQVAGPAEFVMDEDSDAGYVVGRLENGVLHADVAKDPARKDFRVETPHAVVTVLGTQFVLEVTRDATSLTVEEGEVEFRAIGGTESRLVTPESDTVEVHVQRGFVTRPRVESVAPPAAPAAPAVPTAPEVLETPLETPVDEPAQSIEPSVPVHESPKLDVPVSPESAGDE